MQPQHTQARIQRLFRKRKRQAEQFSALAEDQLERNLVRKFGRLYSVRRFVAVWVLLCLALIGCVVVQTRALGSYYQTLQPAPGGIYREGIIGTYTNSNPLYVTGQVNDAVSKLLFASLFKYDNSNRLVGDLAQRYDLDAAGTTYTVKLKPNLTWHDGKPLTAEDVVFTYQTIQNPDAQSPLNVSWQNVTVSAVDSRTVAFKLSNPLSSFPHSLTNGIIPKHAFASANIANYRSMPFSTVRPVGAGPYQLKTIEVSGNSPSTRQEEIELVPFKGYHAGAAAISSFIIHTYPSQEGMVADFRDRNLNAMVGLQRVTPDLAEIDNLQTTVMPLTAANMVFFKTSNGILADKVVRQALVGGTDVTALTQDLPKPVLPVREPFLTGTPGYDPAYAQRYAGEAAANALLDQQGWVRQASGVRTKDGKPLTFKLYAQDVPEYRQVTAGLKQQWKRLGVDAQVYLQDDADLRALVATHSKDNQSYDALVYGISLGLDPDVFVYWHSSQADVRAASRLNLSEYSSSAADSSLEDGRTRQDPVLRTIKYGPFLKAWQEDAPALGLYQPRFLYITRGEVSGLQDRQVTTDTDRFNNVDEWMVRRVPQNIERAVN
jgi:peptide/nickel transport system substrate-binding protein